MRNDKERVVRCLGRLVELGDANRLHLVAKRLQDRLVTLLVVPGGLGSMETATKVNIGGSCENFSPQFRHSA